MARGQNTAGHPGRRVHRERFEANYAVVPAMTRESHGRAETARSRPITWNPVGSPSQSDYGATPARRRANVVVEGDERSGIAKGARGWGKSKH